VYKLQRTIKWGSDVLKVASNHPLIIQTYSDPQHYTYAAWASTLRA